MSRVTSVGSAVLRPRHRPTIVLPLVYCSVDTKSAKKFSVRVCPITTVVMETTQLVLSQFKNFYHSQLRIE